MLIRSVSTCILNSIRGIILYILLGLSNEIADMSQACTSVQGITTSAHRRSLARQRCFILIAKITGGRPCHLRVNGRVRGLLLLIVQAWNATVEFWFKSLWLWLCHDSLLWHILRGKPRQGGCIVCNKAPSMFRDSVIRALWIRPLLLILDDLSYLIIKSIFWERNWERFDWLLCFSIRGWLVISLEKSGCFFIISCLQGIWESVLAHNLSIKEVVHGADFFEELFIVREVKRREHSFKCTSSLVFILSFFE